MLCDDCKKREATFQYYEYINGYKTSFNLCHECYKKRFDEQNFKTQGGSLSGYNPLGHTPMDLDFNIAKQSSGLGGLFSSFSSFFAPPKQEIKICANCGMTSDEFLDGGLVGCESCYSEFRDIILPVVHKVQGNTKHRGKVPNIKSDIWLDNSQLDSENGIGFNYTKKSLNNKVGAGKNPINNSTVSKDNRLKREYEQLMDELMSAKSAEDYERAHQIQCRMKEIKAQIQ